MEKKKLMRKVDEELFLHDDDPKQAWRIFKIMAEFVQGFDMLKQHEEKAVTFFGSARCGFDDEVYKEATRLAGDLSRGGYTIITGGGPGIMEAANKGAFEAGGPSVGVNIKLPKEQVLNRYVTDSKDFHYFFTRKVVLSFVSEVYIFFPGGFGTMDEFFEIVTLVQTKKIKPIPIILYGKEYWNPLIQLFEERLYKKYKAISKDDLNIFHVVDSVEEACNKIKELHR